MPTRIVSTEDPAHWGWGPVQNIQRGLQDHLRYIACLMEHGLTGRDIIVGYYQRRIAPLMFRPLRLS